MFIRLLLFCLASIPLINANTQNTYFNVLPSYITTLKYNNTEYVNSGNIFSLYRNDENYIIKFKPNRTGIYLMGSLEQLQLKWLFGNLNYEFNRKYINNEKEILYYNGFHIFYFEQSIFKLVYNFIKTLNLFIGRNLEKNNIEFIKQKMNFQYEKIDLDYHNYNLSNVQSGDLFLVTRLDGLDQIIMWGTGSLVGHNAIILEINNTKYVCESTDNNPFGKSYWPPPYGIIKTPINKWLNLSYKAKFLVTHLKLREKYRKLFNKDKAINSFLNYEGLPYGYQNFLYGWIDTQENNFPERLNSNLLQILFAFLSRKQKDVINLFFTEGLYKRLNINYSKDNMSISDIILDANKKYITFSKLITIPENDEWVYSTGKSRVCDTLIMSIYKDAGVFGNLTEYLSATEFTPRNLYELDIFDINKYENCFNETYCQVMGDYRMILKNVNTVKPYKNMNEKCNTIPPNYFRNGKC